MTSEPRRLVVHACAPQVLIQDTGRPGYRHLGVGRSGAADQTSYALANRLVGNAVGSACFEVMMGGLSFESNHRTWIAVTGAPLTVRVAGRPAWIDHPIPVAPGETVTLARPEVGLRSYVAIRGGIEVPMMLGSRSFDSMSGLGCDAVEPGVELPIGKPANSMPPVDLAPRPAPVTSTVSLPAILGPRTDWFRPEAIELLYSHCFSVTSDADRVGVRLDGPSLPRRHHGELASEGVVEGSLQAPPNGRLTIFLADHPVTGGYPVIAVLPRNAVADAAQLRPGQGVRFVRARTPSGAL